MKSKLPSRKLPRSQVISALLQTRVVRCPAVTTCTLLPGIVFFKHEPFVLHVQCRSVEAACQLMEVARTAGYRESGISIGCVNTALKRFKTQP